MMIRTLSDFFALALIFFLCASCATLDEPLRSIQDEEPVEVEFVPPAYFESSLSERLARNISEVFAVELVPRTRHAETIDDPLWRSIAQKFALQHTDHVRIQQEIARYRTYQTDFENTLKRAMPYLPLIAAEVEKANIPSEIALLPIVESAFNPHAVSPLQAMGLWQFIPSTGKEYGLKQNWWFDGRRDVYLSTQAAITYLKRLNRRFEGDWFLTLAAYNAGQTKIARAVSNAQKANKSTSYWNLNLPLETRLYVPRLLAVTHLIQQSKYYGIALPDSSQTKALALVDSRGQIDLAKAADAAKVSLKELYKYNPGFKRWASDPDGPFHLLIPAENVGEFNAAIFAIPPDQRVTWYRHKIRTGETLSHIAKHYETSVRLVMQVNQMTNSRIRAGKYLLVPNSNLSLKEHIAFDVNSGARKHVHKVRRGDSLWEIAKQYGVSIRQICDWNRISPKHHLKIGQKLVVIQPIKPT